MTPTRKLGLGGFLLAGAVAGGISLASLNTANAASATTPAAVAATDDGSTASSDTSATAADPAAAGPHTANGITETVLTGDDATKVRTAVLAADPDATIVRMETDADGDTYEAHVTMADGSEATVKLDASFAVTGTETGGPGGPGGGRGGGPHSANGITETELTGDAASSVQAAVTAANPGATIDRMETDADGATYEAHITLADGSHATVKLDASFAITSTETGR
jgi:uncharacterized membrane protein YkoI